MFKTNVCDTHFTLILSLFCLHARLNFAIQTDAGETPGVPATPLTSPNLSATPMKRSCWLCVLTAAFSSVSTAAGQSRPSIHQQYTEQNTDRGIVARVPIHRLDDAVHLERIWHRARQRVLHSSAERYLATSNGSAVALNNSQGSQYYGEMSLGSGKRNQTFVVM